MDLRHLIFSVLFSLSAGTYLSFAVLRPSQVTRRFYLIHGFLFSSIALLAYLLILEGGELPFRIAFFSFLFFSSLFYLFSEKSRLLPLFSFVLGALAAGAAVLLDAVGSVPVSLALPVSVNALLSALFLGVTMSAMLLGHWYLNQPKMSTDELRKMTFFFLAIALLRFLFTSFQAVPLLSGKDEMELYRFFLSETKGIFILMRYTWGILGPLALSYFIWGTVKIRSTQSATGILYVAVVFVLIGEIMSQYLTYFHGVPL